MGRFIVIEGLDGSGKSTQSKLLIEHLEKKGKSARLLSFPCYGQTGCSLVELYLSGKLGSSPEATNGYAASMFFAADRYVSYVTDWKYDYLNKDTILIAARYTTSNAYHQLVKLERDKWDGFISWLYDFEFTRLGLPKPDDVVFLQLPQKSGSRRVEQRCNETGSKKDIHERDEDYLAACGKAAEYVTRKLGWQVLDCAPDGVQKSRDEVFDALVELLEL